MTGGEVYILGRVGDNFAAGMTGGMAFVYDPENIFENYVNSASVVWQNQKLNIGKERLKTVLEEYNSETQSEISKQILQNFSDELQILNKFVQCEMLNKLQNQLL